VPREFLHELRRTTTQHDAALIFDEVITGFRLHPGGAQAFFGVRADLATDGKIVGGGLPIGVVAGRARFMDAFDGGDWQFGNDSIPAAGRTFFAGTFVRHPLALAAGLATLRHLQAEGPALQQRLNARADRFCADLAAVFARHGVPIELVNCGSLMFFRVAAGDKAASLLFYLVRERGVFLLEGFPSYLNTAHSDADLRGVVAAFDQAAVEMRSHGFFGGPVASADDAATPLTEAQNEIWLASQADDDANRAFNETCDLHLDGAFDLEAFRRAFGQLLTRHEALRSQFDPGGAGQRFRADVAIDVPLIDLSAAPHAAERLLQLQDQEDREAFNLSRPPLVRVRVVRVADDDHHILLTAHHIACDGWSYDIILRELGVLYSAELNGTPAELPAPASFRAYAERPASAPADRPYWRGVYASVPEPLLLPADRPRTPARTFRGSRLCRDVGEVRSARVRQTAARLGCTPYALLLAAFKALLARLTGRHDLVVGVPTSGQNLADAPTLVGHCVHFLPLRQAVAADQPFAEFVSAVKATLLDAFDHQDFTYVTLLRDLPPDAARRPPVAVGFNIDPPLSTLSFAGLRASVRKNPKHYVNLELHWNLVDDGRAYALEAEFNTDLFDQASVRRWADAYLELLDHAAAQPGAAVGDLRVVADDERRRVLVAWNATERPMPGDAVHHLFEAQARRRPDSPALLAADGVLTYAELNHRAERLARVLAGHGVGPEVPVTVLLPRTPDLVVALLATLKAGGAYLPLDPSHPPTHHARLIAAARAQVAIAAATAVLPQGVTRVTVDATQPEGAPELPSSSNPDALAAILFTSGSTGAPKGVMVTHRNVVRLLFGVDYCDFGPDCTFAFMAPIAFDAATFEIWGALLHGGRLAIFPDAVPDPAHLGSFLKRHQVNTLWLTAGLFNTVVDFDVSALSGVRQLLTGGEAVSAAHARRAQAALPNVTLINGYGPTETTTFATTYAIPRPVPAEWTAVPIGRPIGNTTVAVLDERQRPVPVGVEGELFIGGAGVTRGYVNEPALTAERFVASPVPELPGPLYRTGDRARWRADGVLEFRGRTDRQVKIRGQRIEPGEIEACLASHPGVAAAAVDVRRTGTDARLVAYVVARPGSPCDVGELHNFVASRLPAAMWPAAVIALDSLPLTPNGKLDRAALPDPQPGADRPPQPAPRTDAERELLALWRDVLDAPGAGVTDNFFDLGGHSLKAIALVGAIRDRLGHAVPLGTLYRAPTVEAVAAVLQNQLEAGSEQSLVPLQPAGDRPPVFLIAGVGGHVFAFHRFARLLGNDQPAYGVKAIGVDGARTPPDTVEATAAEYVREITAVRPQGPLILAGYSIGAGIALEAALQLRAAGRAVPLVIAFDAAAPRYMTYSLPQRLRLHFSNLLLRGGGWRYATQRLRNLKDRWNWATGRAHRNAPTIAGLEMFSQDAINQVWVALHTAYRRYTPARRFDGRILVVRAEVLDDWDKFVSSDPALGWSRWTTRPVASASLPVRHLDLFHEPAIHDVARAVRSAIDAVGEQAIANGR
jgi:amino acid adenylation domain-containing protein